MTMLHGKFESQLTNNCSNQLMLPKDLDKEKEA